MQVSDAMSSDVKIASPGQSIREAARMMAQIDAGSALCGISEPGGGHSQSTDGGRAGRSATR
jgi:hypothetical protein